MYRTVSAMSVVTVPSGFLRVENVLPLLILPVASL